MDTITTIKIEQNKFKNSLSFEEMVKKQQKYEESMNIDALTLEQINQYIDEVRNDE